MGQYGKIAFAFHFFLQVFLLMYRGLMIRMYNDRRSLEGSHSWELLTIRITWQTMASALQLGWSGALGQ